MTVSNKLYIQITDHNIPEYGGFWYISFNPATEQQHNYDESNMMQHVTDE